METVTEHNAIIVGMAAVAFVERDYALLNGALEFYDSTIELRDGAVRLADGTRELRSKTADLKDRIKEDLPVEFQVDHCLILKSHRQEANGSLRTLLVVSHSILLPNFSLARTSSPF